MKLSLRAAGVAGLASALAAGLLVSITGPAAATTTPPYEPDSVNQIGTLAFYNAAGARVTGGSTADSPVAKYVVASADDPIGTNNSGALYGYLPQNGVLPGNWSGEQLSGTTSFPVPAGPSVPTGISSQGTHRPVITGTSGDGTIAGLLADFPHPGPDTGTAYDGLYQLRVLTPGNTKWWAADIQVTGATWTQVYPAVAPTATSTSLGAFPPSPDYVGEQVTLTATVSPAADGTVQFKDGASALGAPVTVAAGQAQLVTSALTKGVHSLTAVFTPTDLVGYAASTSGALSYTVNAVGAPTWRPVLYPSPRVGITSSCLASFLGSPTVAYAWYQNGLAISGATASTYKVAEGYYGKSLTCKVTATNASGVQSALSAAATVGIGPALVPTVKPTLSGTHHYGSYEVCNHGTWSPAATSYLYQWYVGTAKITGATSYHYLMPKAYYGKVISCIVTARRTYWTNGTYHTAGVKIT